jgi:hypothetical protein
VSQSPNSSIFYSNYGSAVVAYLELIIVAEQRNKEQEVQYYFKLDTYPERPINKFAIHVWREKN